ncbi:hypothetical protein EIN_025290 [Entamoeba invadens IP1]|uniref:hypothetical protein n=1 Tax=Entamoeba invadens IP1 TaxID=370355 RepID=UPI0002C3DF86|nr:hypothetical protein EIN_025290 [Entamoeba invadens IP1]ELP90720.1 hypothetical protein EIN_025290 [Entamoeba invadens IP1]|eukprot:XP_004257491.1 hypothetical protein EIN_025290 [Entamoeba invadens IP1]
MRNNALLTSVEVTAPLNIQTCFLQETPKTKIVQTKDFIISKLFPKPTRAIFFSQMLLPESVLTFQYTAFKQVTPQNISMYLLQGEKEFQRFQLGLIVSPIYYIENSPMNHSTFELTNFDFRDLYYFAFETFSENTTVSMSLNIGFSQFYVEDSTKEECAYGNTRHDFVAGEVMVTTNTQDIYSLVRLDFSGKFVSI